MNVVEKIQQNYEILDQIQRCIQFIEEHDMESIESGSYEIDGEEIFVNIFSYETQEAENRIWEAHREYVDLHYVINGCEKILVNDIHNMTQGSYEPQNDFLPLEGDAKEISILKEKEFLVCLEEEGHKTGVSVLETVTVKKAVFKIKGNQFNKRKEKNV